MVEFSSNFRNMRSSAIRELMGVASRPETISFAGGMPNNGLFPVEEIDRIIARLPREVKQVGFQYGPTHGYPPLCSALKDFLARKGLPIENHELMMTTGSLQALHLIDRVYLDPGDVVVTENPCFIGGIAAIRAHQGILRSVPLDEEGIDIAGLQEALDQGPPRPKLLYLTPNFHNPAGIVYSRERRQAVLSLLPGRDIVMVEDDAYSELYFEEQDRELVTPIKALGPNPVPICYTGSFSKILGPGFRLGWLLAPTDIMKACELAKQSIDACTPTFSQVIAHEFLVSGQLDRYVAFVRGEYARRSRIMREALREYMPEGVRWNRPRGGFYIWVQLPRGLDSAEVLQKTIAAGVIFVVGKTFDPEARLNDRFRLAFSHTPEEKIADGIRVIAGAIRDCLS